MAKSLFLSYLWITLIAVGLVGFYGARVARRIYEDRTKEDLLARARLCSSAVVDLLQSEPDKNIRAFKLDQTEHRG